MENHYPILYSFRRCPYAMRARMAIKVSQRQVELREVILKDKPPEMLAASPKGTVPIIQLSDKIIDESLDIMYWALKHHDPENWLQSTESELLETSRLIEINDNQFKKQLDQYKYADRFPLLSEEEHRQQGEFFLQELENRLKKSEYLLGNEIKLLDIAVFPFVRQFAYVDKIWFAQSDYKKLQKWLTQLLESPLFNSIMQKNPIWSKGDDTCYL